MNALLCIAAGVLATSLPVIAAAQQAPSTRPSTLRHLRQEHPRLLATAGDFDGLRERLASDAVLRRDADALLARADDLLDKATSVYELPDGKRLLATSRQMVARTYDLAMAWRLTGDPRYADRLYVELEAATDFPDWNPSHFLDTGEMAHAFAIGLDWAGEAWTDEQRERVRDAIVAKGLVVYLDHVENRRAWWHTTSNNWNLVCNGGMTLAALAVAEHEPELASRVVDLAVEAMPRSIASLAPDGASAEGPGYWAYSMRYLVPTLAGLESATGSARGLDELPGVAEAGWFALHATSPAGLAFNYADGQPDWLSPSPIFYWLAARYDAPALAAYRHGETAGTGALDLLWRPETIPATPADLPTAARFRGVEVVTFRENWTDVDALYLAAQFGPNAVGHNQADLGTFVLDSGGIRWFLDLGSDNYNLPGYFDEARWDFYRCRTESHNTLVVNPTRQVNQDVDAGGRLTAFDADAGTVTADLTDAYLARGATSVVRSFAFDGEERAVRLVDHVELREPGVVRWHAHTRADVEVAPDGRSATLREDGRELAVSLEDHDDLRLHAVAARPLPSSPDPAGQNDNEGVTRLEIVAESVTDVAFSLQFKVIR